MTAEYKDLIVLTADKDALLGIRQLLSRTDDLAIRPIRFECVAHPKHDSGVFTAAHDFLRPFLRRFAYALAIFDLEGCGHERLGRDAVEQKVAGNLAANGWQDRCAVVALALELEAWVWDDSLCLSRALKWEKQRLRSWLVDKRFLASPDTVKPLRPKEAFEAALRTANQKKSSAVFQDLAQFAIVTGCRDVAFQKFLRTLQSWFPRQGNA